MAIDPRELRRCLGHFATGVTVVTCTSPESGRHGATVNAFTAVSLDPPLVLVSLDRRSTLCGLLGARPFTVNVLEASQRELALHFAGRPGAGPVAWDDPEPGTGDGTGDGAGDGAGGAPRLAGCVATVSCAPWRHYDGGDHVLYLGEVQEFRVWPGQPLLFHGGEFRDLVHPPGPWADCADGPAGTTWFTPTHLEAAHLDAAHLQAAHLQAAARRAG